MWLVLHSRASLSCFSRVLFSCASQTHTPVSMRVAPLKYMCGTTHSNVWHDSFTYIVWLDHAWLDSDMCVAWLIHVCGMTDSRVWHDSNHVWRDADMCVAWLRHVCGMIQSGVCDSCHAAHQTYTHTCSITCGMTQTYVWHDSSMCVWLLSRSSLNLHTHNNVCTHTKHTHTHAPSCAPIRHLFQCMSACVHACVCVSVPVPVSVCMSVCVGVQLCKHTDICVPVRHWFNCVAIMCVWQKPRTWIMCVWQKSSSSLNVYTLT